MNLSQLLAARPALVRQVRLAHTAHAYATLRDLAQRVARARLQGPVILLPVDPACERYSPQLIALSGHQSVLEEHFDEGDLVRLADALAFLAPSPGAPAELEFSLEELFTRFAPPLRDALRAGGIALPEEVPAPDPHS